MTGCLSLSYGLRFVLVVFAYFVTGKAGLAMPYVGSSITLLWPPTGIALATFLRFGTRYVPAIWLGAFAVNMTTGISTLTALCIATGNTLGPLLGQQLLSRMGQFRPAMNRTRDVWWFLGAGAILPMLVPPTFGIAGLVAAGSVPWSGAFSAWRVWWLGDAVGVMIAAPPLLTYEPQAFRRLWNARALPFALTLLATVILAALAFLVRPTSQQMQAPIAYLSMVLVIWAGLRWGVFAGSSFALLMSVMAGVGTAFGTGPFALEDTYLGLNLLWSFIAVTSLASLLTLALQVERDRANTELRESERRLSATIAYLPGLVYRRRHRAEGQQAFLSGKAAAITGYQPEQLLAGNPSYEELIDPADRARVADEVAAAIEAKRPFEIEYHIRTADGKDRFCLEYGDALRDENGTVRELESIVFDHTERKQIEQALLHSQRMEAVGRLAGGIAHDFNNLLMVIVGFAEVIRGRAAENDPQRTHATEILTAAHRGAELVRQLLAYSRKQVLRPREVYVSALVSDLQRLLARIIGADIVVVQRLASRGRVSADPSQLEQVVMNLVLNAADAMPEGGELCIATEDVVIDDTQATRPGTPPAGKYVMLTVSDTGTGMTDDVRAHAFEPFFTTKEVGKGTGLGLATAHGIVQQSHGYITLESELGCGTTFRVYLPSLGEVARAVSDAASPSP